MTRKRGPALKRLRMESRGEATGENMGAATISAEDDLLSSASLVDSHSFGVSALSSSEIEDVSSKLSVKPLIPVVNEAIRDVYFALLTFYISFAPSEQLFSAIVRIVNILIKHLSHEQFPVKVDQFLQRVVTTGTAEKHFYCGKPECEAKYCGKASAKCSVCHRKPDKKSFFLYSSVETYLRQVLEFGDLSRYLEDQVTHNSYSDCRDGTEFRRIQAAHPNSIQLMLHVDGVPLYRTSAVSLLPATVSIINYPITDRYNRQWTCALWCDRLKPNFAEFLTPFVNELVTLGTRGMQWTLDGVQRQTKVFLTLVTADAIARAPLQQLQQHNGRYGCPACITPSLAVRDDQPLHRYYPIRMEPTLRTSQSTLEIGTLCQVSKTKQSGIFF